MTDPQRKPAVLVVGTGRAGGSFAAALAGAGWQVGTAGHEQCPLLTGGELGRHDLVLLCVPDQAVAGCAEVLAAPDDTVVAHCAGSLGLEVLHPAARRASVHPLVSLPDPHLGSERLRGAWFAVAGDPIARRVVDSLGGRSVEVTDDRRVAYHAAATVASNHLVGLLAQVERIAAGAGVPLEAYLELARGSLDSVAALGPADALTGPVARGDWGTVRAHLEALPPGERAAYLAGVAQVALLAGREVPGSLGTFGP